MSVSELSVSTQNYLKVIWGLSEWSDEPVTATDIAQKSGLKVSSVSDAVRRLTAQGLVSHARYGAVELTTLGRKYALDMVRRHRLLETFLVRTLGYDWDQVHDEAENLEHAMSDFMVERLDEFLGHPTRDPHGDPIPAADGALSVPDAVLLSTVEPGERVTVERISDEDPALLQYLSSQGVVPGVRLLIAELIPFSDAVQVDVEDGNRAVTLGRQVVEALYVSRV
ncbi:transcriptional regulator [Arthrobacter sp. MYb227]|uniref:metal-dependent transcriptional regulator n=1 Tax=Arthrobacter sp. MYb227 TaxID=1848601 RepID=UPI000CFDE615|nr:metal-dependent transcriptional regulator [Arthrobacter sp. MYb227]PQZ94964.1 transcriptional regulator [Arthrobacter sp. MYb227]